MFRKGLITFALFCALPAWAAPTNVVILHTNDTHNHLLPFANKQSQAMGGIAKRSTLIQQIRQKEGALVLDAGDAFQGTPSYTFFKGEADYLLMKALGYDATTIGNHELDDGLANVKRQVDKSGLTMIQSNLFSAGKPIFIPSKIFSLHGQRIAVFALIGDDSIGTVAAKNLASMNFIQPAEAARRMVKELRPKADLVVCLSHEGYQEDKALAQKVTGIDLIIGGHSHTTLKQPEAVVNGNHTTYIVQTGQWGENLGRVDAAIENGKLVSLKGQLIPVDANVTEDSRIAKLVDNYEASLKAKMDEVVAHVNGELHVNDKYNKQCPLGSWASDLVRDVTKADIAVLNTGGLRAMLHQGPITVGNIYTAFPFDNIVVTIDVTGELLQEILNQNLESLPTRGLALQVSGMTWTVKDGKAEGLVGGKPLAPNKTYRLATVDYIAQGNDKMGPFNQGTNYTSTGRYLRDTMIEYLRAHPNVTVPTDVRFTR